MKPRIFIGSSSENLDLAYLIQENLEHDAETTVWTQGIFKLSKSALDSLLESLEDFDFGIFVFQPDDITQIRNEEFNTVRDNLIFELGLFFGKLGKERVFFVVPRTIEKLHLPTDILGISAGTYDNTRKDGNIQASLGPFCNQIRQELKNFIYENLEDISDEPTHIKQIVINKSSHWELEFASELLKHKLKPINSSIEELEKGLIISRVKTVDVQEFFDWYGNSIQEFKNFVELFAKCSQNMVESFGAPGVAGKPIEIKNSIERIIQLCKELVNWESELNSFIVPEGLEIVKEKMQGSTKELVLNQLNLTQKELERICIEKETQIELSFNPKMPEKAISSIEDFKRFFNIDE